MREDEIARRYRSLDVLGSGESREPGGRSYSATEHDDVRRESMGINEAVIAASKQKIRPTGRELSLDESLLDASDSPVELVVKLLRDTTKGAVT